MAKPNNMQARMTTDGDYNGKWNESRLFDLVDMQRADIRWEYFDQYNKPCVIRDSEGNIVGMIGEYTY
jgi:hypothetical protein